MSRVGLFFDRDGVLNINTHYPHLTEDLYLPPTVLETFKLIKCFPNITCIIVSNQSGVGKGYFVEKDVLDFERALRLRILNETGYCIEADHWYHCYSSEETHPWRKPNPGMLLQAAQDWEIDLNTSAMFGDNPSDIKAGDQSGVHSSYLIDYHHEHYLYDAVFGFLYNYSSLPIKIWQQYFAKESQYV